MMNEQINRLCREKADYWMNHYDRKSKADMELLYQDVEKFAELIINECGSVIEKYGLSLISDDEKYLGETLNLSIKVQEATDKIKQHFNI